MSQRRTLILVAAIAIGALASFLVWNYVNGVQDEAYSGAERVPVYLIKQQVPQGMVGTEAQAYIVKENIPRKFKPSNAIVSLEDIAGKVAVSNLVPNQVVVTDMFVDASDPRAQESFSQRLKQINGKDQVALTIQVDEVRGVSGLIQPGDYVNIMYIQQGGGAAAPGDSNESASPANSGIPGTARVIYEKVKVLAVDKSAVPQPGEAPAGAEGDGTTGSAPAESSGLLTLIVPTDASQVIASVAQSGSMYLSLVAADYKPKGTQPIDTSQGTPNETGDLTPYGPKGDQSEG